MLGLARFVTHGSGGSGPSLNFNFVDGSPLSSQITFTRASSATFVGSNGLIQTAAVNAPRFDYDPVTLAAKGLLIEEQRTNLFIRSDDFSAWTQLNVTVTADSTVSPDGTSNADTIALNAGTATKYVGLVATGATVPCVMTVYAKAGTHSFIQLMNTGDSSAFANFDISTGVVGTKGGKVTSSISAAGNGWYRCVAAFDATATIATTFRIYGAETASSVYSGTTTSTGNFFLWGAQLEAGAFATSYIPTVASQVTRSTDVASVNTLSPWYNETEGTLFAEWSQYAIPVVTTRVATIDSGTTANILQVQSAGVNRTGALSVASVGVFAYATSPITVNAVNKIGIATKSGDSSVAVGGVTLGTSTATYTPPAMTTLRIGSNIAAGQPVNGHIRRITYYPRRLPNATLQQITS